MKKIIIALLFFCIIQFIFSEVIILEDGKKIVGKMIKMDEDTVTVLTENDEMIFDRDEIVSIFRSEEDYNESIKKVENIPTKEEVIETGNIIKNGDFSNNDDWWLIAGWAVFHVESGIAVIDVEKNINTSHIGFSQKLLKFEKDTTYTVKFQAKASIFKDFKVAIQQIGGDWTFYHEGNYRLTKNMKEYKFTFKANNKADNAEMRFVFKCEKCKIYIDNIEITKR